MFNIRLLAVCCLAGLPGSLFAAAPERPRPRLIVAIVVDQLRYDYLERFGPLFGEGGFRMLMEEGAYMTSARYDYAPTVTGPGHASIFAGSPPSVHGIIGNDWFDKKTRKSVGCVSDPAMTGVGNTVLTGGKVSPHRMVGGTFADELRLRFDSKVVGISIKDRGAVLPAGKKPLGAYWYEGVSGRFITSSYYQTELPAWLQEFNGLRRPSEFIGKKWERLLAPDKYAGLDAVRGEGSLPGEKTTTFPHTVARTLKESYEQIVPTPYGDLVLRELAEAAIEGEALGQGMGPDLLCVSFSSLDACGHRFGPYSHEVQDVVLRLDRELATLFASLEKRFAPGEVAIMLTADHGVAPTPEWAAVQGLGGERVDEVELMDELLVALEGRFGAVQLLLTRGSLDGQMHFNHETLREQGISTEELFAFIRDWALATGKIQACFGREQLLEGRAPGAIGARVLQGYSAERGGDAVLVYKPYVLDYGSLTSTGTNHGSPYNYDTHVPVLLYGAAFRPGRYADPFAITDIVPTMCAAYGVEEPAGATGKVLLKALAGE